MAQPATSPPAEVSRASPALVPNNTAAGAKRKRATEKKFYAVKEGKTRGVFNTWDECLAQVRGHKGAVFKAFQSLHEANAFVDGTLLISPSAKQPGEQKFYGVQNGKKPGVYLDWPSAMEQIRGVKGPKHRRFNSHAEAQAFVDAGKKNFPFDISQNLSPEEEIRQLIIRKSAPGLIPNGTHQPKDKEGNPYPLGTGPLPSGAEDGYDPNLKLAADGTIQQKTDEEKAKTKMIIKEKEPPGMLRIYTDGSSLRNGQPGARAGVGVFFGPQDPKNVSEALKGSKQTNQRAELTAIQRALDIAPRHRDVTIYTDSRYSIDCATKWYKKWVQNGWKNALGKPVENKDIVMDIREQIDERDLLKKQTCFVWVKGHANDEGNIAADKLAVEGSAMARVGSDEVDDYLERADDVSESVGTEDTNDVNGDDDDDDDDDDEDDDVQQAFRDTERAMSGDEGDSIN